MKYIIDFYKDLDMVNLIVFWGTIIVVILLLTFSIILANKNKKLKHIIESKGIDINSFEEDDELAIKKDSEIKIIKENNNYEEEIIDDINEDIPILKQEVKQTEKFTPEELVMEYNKPEDTNYYQTENKQIINNNLENINKIQNDKISYYNDKNEIPKQNDIVNTQNTYNNNYYKERLNQTSPIGIIKKENITEKELAKAKELQNNLHYEDIKEKEINIPNINSVERQRQIAEEAKKRQIAEEVKRRQINEEKPRGNYLEEISKSLSKITNSEDINRTAYELRQEEEAIISYKELMEKKDSIETVDEEEAVISIEELIAKKKEQDKLYNITNDAEDDKFIDELKNFRSDL